MIHFCCPHCHTDFEGEDSWSGQPGRCEVCGRKFTIEGRAGPLPVMHEERPSPRLVTWLLPVVVGLIAAAAAWFFLPAGGKRGATSATTKLPESAFIPALHVATNGPVLHQWNFDEARDWHDSPFGPPTNLPAAVFDVAGGWDLTPVDLAASNWVSGREFQALELPGRGHLAAPADLGPEFTRAGSVAFWLRTDRTNAGGIAGDRSVQWGRIDEHGHIVFSMGGTVLARSPQPVADGRWHAVVLVNDAAATSLFVDGEPADQRAGPVQLPSASFRSIGRIEGDDTSFAGRLDKLTLFARALTAEEVKTFGINHAPKSWDTHTDVPADRPFTTESVLYLAYDTENDPLEIHGWTKPTHGSVEPLGDGSFRYTAADGFTGDDAFDVVVHDGHAGFHRSTMRVRVVPETATSGIPTTQFAGLAPVPGDGAAIAYRGWRVPRAIDWDRDGRIDLLVGAQGFVWLHRNTGNAATPRFSAGVKLSAGGQDLRSGDQLSSIALADLTGDGQPDLALADSAGRLLVYADTSGGKQARQLAAPVTIKRADGTDFALPDRRFDLGEWENDGRVDLITGTGSGDVKLFLNNGTPAAPRFAEPRVLMSGSYNLSPKFCDLDGNGGTDLARGINWGGVSYWLEPAANGLEKDGAFSLSGADGRAETLRDTDGAFVDFADFNGDGVPDLVVGGHTGDRLLLGYGVRKTAAQLIAATEAIYDAHPHTPGAALGANTNALLQRVNENTRGLVALLEHGTPALREGVYKALAAHVAKYPFLRYQHLDTNRFHHVPGIVLQNWVLLTEARPHTPLHFREVADLLGLTGTARTIYLERGLTLGDNGLLNEAQLGTVRDLMRHHPRAIFPDAVITFDQLYGDGRGGFVWTPNSTKNTFGCDVGLANEWARDLTEAIEADGGKGAAHGDYFTFVMGHEVTHSMDHYVNTRANRDLRRRWGQVLCRAAGPDVVAATNGWVDWEATKKTFQAGGNYDPSTETWDAAWKKYWEKGPGAKFRHTSFMRGGIDWFMHAPQESLATQANHHWASGPGRLVGALARFRRGMSTGNLPEKANMTEVVDFIDYLSAGMNRVALPKTTTIKTATEKRVDWAIHYADLERNDQGRITRITVDGRVYALTLDAGGTVIDVH